MVVESGHRDFSPEGLQGLIARLEGVGGVKKIHAEGLHGTVRIDNDGKRVIYENITEGNNLVFLINEGDHVRSIEVENQQTRERWQYSFNRDQGGEFEVFGADMDGLVNDILRVSQSELNGD